jgi:protein tyrosine phosphatase
MEYKIYQALSTDGGKWYRYSDIDGHIYLGGVPYPLSKDAKNEVVDYARKNKICNIVSISDYKLDWNNPNINWINITCPDVSNTDLHSVFDVVSNFIDDAVKRGEKVLIHCHAGVSRSVTLLAAYLILCRGMSTKQALQFIKSKRSFIRPNIGFIRQLLTLEKSVNSYRK